MGCSKCGIKKVKYYPLVGSTQSESYLIMFTRSIKVYTSMTQYIRYEQGFVTYLDFDQINIISEHETFSIKFLDEEDKKLYLGKFPESKIL